MKSLLAFALAVVLFGPAVASAQQCSQPVSSGSLPVATDCLFILGAAVGLQNCASACVCDVNGSGGAPNATDSLVCLNVAVGVNIALDCPCDVTTTTDSTTTTTITLPPGDDDNDGIENSEDPCPDETLNRCAGTIATDSNNGREIRINAINPNDANYLCRGQRIDCNGDVWDADFGYNHQSAAFECNLGGEGCSIQGLEDIFGCRDENTADIFRCEHFGPPSLTNLTYTFGVPDGSYIVNFLFGNVYDQTVEVGSRVFDVAVESAVVLADFDQVLAAGSSGRAVARSVLVDVTDGDGLQIEFLPIVQNPAVKGIEILHLTN
jgi:hypothetical protein